MVLLVLTNLSRMLEQAAYNDPKWWWTASQLLLPTSAYRWTLSATMGLLMWPYLMNIRKKRPLISPWHPSKLCTDGCHPWYERGAMFYTMSETFFSSHSYEGRLLPIRFWNLCTLYCIQVVSGEIESKQTVINWNCIQCMENIFWVA